MEIRLAFPNEVAAILTILEEAKRYLKSLGSEQWQSGYPDKQIILEDIVEGRGYVAVVEGEIAAYTAVVSGPEAVYQRIYDGAWLTKGQDYLTFHRVAVADKFRGQQIIQTLLEGLIEGFDSDDFRSDTHIANQTMQHIFEKLGFEQVGKVDHEIPCFAYQKLKKKKRREYGLSR